MLKSVRVGAESGAKPAVLVVGVFQGASGASPLDAATKKLDKGGDIAKAARRDECTGATGCIAEAFPDDAILGEEFGASEGAGDGLRREWIIDPIDGTIAFSRGIPLFTTLVALVVEGVAH